MEKQFTTIPCLLILVVSVSSICCHQEDFVRCPRGQVFNGQQLATQPARSRLECAVLCSETGGCVGVNVCPTGSQGKMMCGLMREYHEDGCRNLTLASSTACFFMQKRKQQITTKTTTTMPTTKTTTSPTVTVLVCQNGGTPNSTAGRCMCPPKFGGRNCQRLVRDCSEVYENGYTTSDYDGYYDILPSTASGPFQVRCAFGWGVGITYPYIRSWWYNFSMNYATTKAGFGEYITPNYFIGLDKLHHLLKQGGYVLHVYFQEITTYKERNVFYENFTVASEADGYGLSFDSVFSPNDAYAQDGFSSSKPVRFSTYDRDIYNGCAGANGGASGWYGADCSTYNGLFAPKLTWRLYDGTVSAINYAEFNLVRRSQTASWVD